jgi:hypothetical protein
VVSLSSQVHTVLSFLSTLTDVQKCWWRCGRGMMRAASRCVWHLPWSWKQMAQECRRKYDSRKTKLATWRCDWYHCSRQEATPSSSSSRDRKTPKNDLLPAKNPENKAPPTFVGEANPRSKGSHRRRCQNR